MSTKIMSRKERAGAMLQMLNANLTQMEQALPKHCSADRMLRVTLTSLRKNPTLIECDPKSLLSCVLQASALGLEIDNGLGHAYLVPFRVKGQMTCTLIVGYRGLIDLAYRSGAIDTIMAAWVREGDTFEYELGLTPKLRHVPNEDLDVDPKGKDITHAYAVCVLKSGGRVFEVMNRKEVDAIRARSRAGNSGPWVTDYPMMARKTAIRRLVRYLPQSIELQRAAAIDGAWDAGPVEQRKAMDPALDVGRLLAPDALDGIEEAEGEEPIDVDGEEVSGAD